jgi:CDP-glucose 4,6-dehydratase
MGMNYTFWQNKRILITGHTGFKGSWLSLWLKKLGAEVTGYALKPPTTPSLFEICHVANGMNSIEGDVRDLDHLIGSIKECKPEIVIHMAAQALVQTSYKNPIETYTTNTIGTANVLEAVRRTEGIRVVVCITSDKCYENREWLWGYRENDLLGGKDPYSSSKGCAELIIAAYRHSYFPIDKYDNHGVALASTRAGNVIGGGDWANDRLIPDIMKSIYQNKSIIIRKPNATRPWQYVLEPLSGYLMLAEQLWYDGPQFAQSWNFGPNIEDIKPVSWIVDYIAKSWGNGAHWKLDEVQHPHEDTFLKLDCSKAKSMLHWSPILRLPDVLDWIVEWYRSYKNKTNIREITESQITKYQALRG